MKKYILAALLIFLSASLIACKDFLLDFFSKDPSEKVSESLKLAGAASSFNADMILRLQTEEGYSIVGTFHDAALKETEISSLFEANIFFPQSVLSISGEFKEVKGSFYLLLSSLPDLPLLGSFMENLGIKLEELEGEWIRMDSDFFSSQKKEAMALENILFDPASYLIGKEQEKGSRSYSFLLAENAASSLADIFRAADFGGKGEILITEDGYPEKLVLEGNFFSSAGEFEMEMQIDFSGFNQVFLIEPPETFKEIEDILSEN
jgi:hypothetical protein